MLGSRSVLILRNDKNPNTRTITTATSTVRGRLTLYFDNTKFPSLCLSLAAGPEPPGCYNFYVIPSYYSTKPLFCHLPVCDFSVNSYYPSFLNTSSHKKSLPRHLPIPRLHPVSYTGKSSPFYFQRTPASRDVLPCGHPLF